MERRLGVTVDGLTAAVAPLEQPGAEGLPVDVAVVDERCERDEEWFWGPVDDARLEARAVITFDVADAPAISERVDAVAESRDAGLSGQEWRYRPEGNSWESYALDIELAEAIDMDDIEADTGLVDLAVSFGTPCLTPGDQDRLGPIAEDRAQRLVEALAGTP